LLNRLTHRFLIRQTLAVSPDVRRTLASNAGLDAVRIDVVPNGVDPAPEPTCESDESGVPLRRPGEVRFGAFGRLSPEKGLTVLLQAMALLGENEPLTYLFLAGEGPQREELERLVRDLNLCERVTFLGFRSDARALMRQMDVIVHVPDYEGFGLVMTEAMAEGRPLVVNDAPGGMTEVVKDGVNGLVVRAGDAESLAAALGQLARDPGRREQLGVSGLAIFRERYSADTMARSVAAFYEAASS
jgi:glycosyltransferase involved in cell wall biosynthesis